jgi:hypothetical protein
MEKQKQKVVSGKTHTQCNDCTLDYLLSLPWVSQKNQFLNSKTSIDSLSLSPS